MADRRAFGNGLARIRPAGRVGLELDVSTGAPVIPANEALPTNRWLVGVWITRTAWPAWTASRAVSSAL